MLNSVEDTMHQTNYSYIKIITKKIKYIRKLFILHLLTYCLIYYIYLFFVLFSTIMLERLLQ